VLIEKAWVALAHEASEYPSTPVSRWRGRRCLFADTFCPWHTDHTRGIRGFASTWLVARFERRHFGNTGRCDRSFFSHHYGYGQCE
jgi:hypothetical protein